MWPYFTRWGSYRWIYALPELMRAYNASKHRGIGMAPGEVTAHIEHELWLEQEEKGPQKVTDKEPRTRFVVGDEVRLSKAKKVFEKGYLLN